MTNRYNIENRRYIGNKSKLNDWIMKNILSAAPNAKSFCDIFAGTGTVANQALKHFNRVIINDLLFSNQVVYGAFFANGKYDENKLQSVVDKFNIQQAEFDNWFSISYGDKFFDMGVARQIGFIREQRNVSIPENCSITQRLRLYTKR